jgi:membrane protease YdiL (CAAX protease family)
MARSWSKVAIVTIAFLLSYFSLTLVGWIPGYRDWLLSLPSIWLWVENAVRPLVPVLLGLLALYGFDPRRWSRELGMDRPLVPALLLAAALTLPLTLVPPLLGVRPSAEGPPLQQLFSSGIWPLGEEINFRGFAFGQIQVHSGLGFWPAGLLTSALFGIAHMANAAAAGHDLGGQLANALIVGISALGLAWLYFRWNKNLWLVFFLHALGNFGASLYMSGKVAVGDNRFITLLVITLILAVAVTALRDRFPWSGRVTGA